MSLGGGGGGGGMEVKREERQEEGISAVNLKLLRSWRVSLEKELIVQGIREKKK